MGRAEEAFIRFRQGCDLAFALNDGEREVRARGWLGVACAGLGRFREAEEHLTMAIDQSEKRGLEHHLCDWHYHLAEMFLATGRDASGQNRKAEDFAVHLNRYDMVFLCRLQKAKIDFAQAPGQEGRLGAVDEVMRMMEGDVDKGQKARLYFECWRMLESMGKHGEAGVMGKKSAVLYRELAEETDGAECRTRLSRLTEAGKGI